MPEPPEVKDIDYLVTGIPYEDLCRILKKFGRVDTVGRSFGVIKFTQPANGKSPGGTFDFVLPRKEISIGSAHRDFEVDFDYNLNVEDDLHRRDFTINAIAKEVSTGEYVDPLNGREDLKAGVIRFTSPESFSDDPLRMLRAVQFAARFEFEIEPTTMTAICSNARMIETVSAERIQEELNKLLERSRRPSVGFKLMHETGLLRHIIPELEQCVRVIQPGPYHKYPVFEHSIYTADATPPRLPLRMAALLHDITKPQAKREVEGGATFYGHETSGARVARRVLRRLRYGNKFIEQVGVLVERHMFSSEVSDKGLRRLIRRVGQDLIFDLLDLRRADVVAQGMGGTTTDVDELEQRIKEEIKRKPPFGLADLDIDGTQLMNELGLPEGRQVGEVLNHLLELVLDVPEDNKYEILINEAKNYLDNKAKGR